MITYKRGISLSQVEADMARLTREGILSPAVRQLAEQTGGTPQGIFSFIRSTFPYIPDPEGTELFIAPNRIAEDYLVGRVRGGDCDDLAMLTAATMGSVGVQTRLVLLATEGWEVDHAIAQMRSPVLGWLDADATGTFPLGWHVRGTRRTVDI